MNDNVESMTETLITSQDGFEALCDDIRTAGLVAFDTEFVSEFTYRPQLCLLQFATPRRLAAVDPFEVTDLSAWWDLMTDDRTTVVVHGGREEIRFCLAATQTRPRKLVDVQLAEGLRSRGYPLAYSTLVQRVLGRRAHGKETRTDWRRRPLSPQQITYSLDDVRYVLEIWDRQQRALHSLGRLEWAEAEFLRFVDDIEAEQARNTWRRLSGVYRLSPREMAVVRELYNWREHEAERLDRPVRSILRDDLLLELARRQPATVHDLLATRDMNRTSYKRSFDSLLACIRTGIDCPDDQLPTAPPPAGIERNDDEHVLGKLLGIALANRCAELNVSMPLVGTTADLRQLVRWHVYREETEPPRLAQGWRAEVCGDLLTDLLDGKISLRVADPDSDHPLVFESLDGASRPVARKRRRRRRSS